MVNVKRHDTKGARAAQFVLAMEYGTRFDTEFVAVGADLSYSAASLAMNVLEACGVVEGHVEETILWWTRQ